MEQHLCRALIPWELVNSDDNLKALCHAAAASVDLLHEDMNAH